MSDPESRSKPLELDEDIPFQRREWRVQTVGWFAWAIVLVAAGAGLLGSGPLSHQQVTATDGSLEISYDRFVHHHHPMRLEIRLHRPGNSQETVQLRINQAFLDAVEIRRMHPEARDVSLETDGSMFHFRIDDSADAAKIVLHCEYEVMGPISGEFQLAGSAPVRIQQFVYP